HPRKFEHFRTLGSKTEAPVFGVASARMDPADLPEGTRLLDRYVILDRVATGGMASIFRARDERLDRVVCVKLFRLVVEGDGSRVYNATYAHFLEEAKAFSRL